jgi:transcriptional regulator with XRE-family HTH domain
MKKAKAKKIEPTRTTVVDAYISARIRERRQELDMSQDALAKSLGITFQQIQKYERGENRISAARLFEICKILKVSLSSMFDRDPKE